VVEDRALEGDSGRSYLSWQFNLQKLDRAKKKAHRFLALEKKYIMRICI